MIRRLRTLLAVAAAASLGAGCLPRLTDPWYAFKPLRAPEPRGEGETLVFGTLEFESGFIGPDDFIEIDLTRVRPTSEDFDRVLATKLLLFRAFRDRQIKDGHFLGSVQLGAYELRRLIGNDLGRSILDMDEDGRRASRFTATRPGIIDLGVFHMKRGFLGSSFTMVPVPRSERPERLAVLKAAIAGTSWERFLPGEGRP